MSTTTTHIVKPLNTDKLYPDGMIKVESDNAITDYMIGDSVFVFCRNINDYSNQAPCLISTMPTLDGVSIGLWRKGSNGIFQLETDISPKYFIGNEPLFTIMHKIKGSEERRVDIRINY